MDWIRQKTTFRKLICKRNNRAGRNRLGRITVRHKGGGLRRVFRVLDHQRTLWNIPGIVLSLERGTNSYFIAAIVYPIGIITYITAPQGLRIGDKLIAGWTVDSKQVGNAMPLINIPLNIKIHNIEAFPGSGAVYARSAGTFGIVTETSPSKVLVVLASGIKKELSPYCQATIGRVSNVGHRNTKFFKAGHSRWAGIRPTVRGVAMNAVEHPHGGGKGKKSKNSVPQSPWGRLGKGQKSVLRNK